MRSPERNPLDQVSSILERLLDVKPSPVKFLLLNGLRADLVLEGPKAALLVEWKPVGDTANVGSAVRQLKEFARGWRVVGRRPGTVVPIVAVPFMGETGRRLCADAGVSWLDLSGNAWIDAPGRQIRFLGHRNRFASAGRPADVFAPRSSRVVRALLMEPQRRFTQAELAVASGVDKGRVSRLVRRLEAMDLVVRDGRALGLKDTMLALDAWREAYDFETHDVRRGHVAVRDPEELIDRISGSAASVGLSWSITGLAAAWRLTHFAMFRLVTIYTRDRPRDDWLAELGFREEPRGANLWVVRPVDDGVFEGASSVDGVSCVHPIQAYLDLKAHPERAAEAAGDLRMRLLAGEEA